MRIHILGSGSEGNALVIESDRQRVMVDAGFGIRELSRRLQLVDVAPDTVTGLIVTHEHQDHVRGAGAAARKYRWPVYATAGTVRSDSAKRDERRAMAPGPAEGSLPVSLAIEPPAAKRSTKRRVAKHVVDTHTEVLLDDFAIRFIKAPHDAREPVSLVATVRSTGERIGIAYDVGHISERFIRHFGDLDVLILESNHDERMLATGPYPWPLKQRVAGPNGHLGNAEAGIMARACAHGRLRHLVLCHLSQVNNRPEIALKAMRGALRGSAFRGTLMAAPQDRPITIGPPDQIELGL
ncbi:MAG: MBL fold metallo-hydrolase [Gemmatimonadaceae bacterium]|nr:MBL fold metallo-hydrolase [Gemmatimonadaceae bacterium]